MSPIVVDGKHIAGDILDKLVQQPAIKGFVAIFISSGDGAASSFVKQKEIYAKQLGIETRRYEVLSSDTNDTLRARVRRVANAKRCVGVIIQLPLPSLCNSSYIANTIPPQKDIDCLGARNLGAFFQGRGAIIPPAVRVVKHILQKYEKGIHSVASVSVVGQGKLIGQPISAWLGKEISCVNSFDKGFDSNKLKDSEIIILGTGSAGLISGKDVASGAWVIDFGYGRTQDGKLVGDFNDTKNSIDHLGLYTPTPGGTGPILVVSLLENLYASHGY